MELKDKILLTAKNLFFQRGLKSISMDDICAEIGISKKTFYTQFESKDELVANMISIHMQEDFDMIQQIRSSTENAIEELMAICDFNCAQHKTMNPIFIYDIKKFYPTEWLRIETFIGQQISICVSENIKRGQNEGYFRLDIHIDFITNLYLKGILNMIEYFSTQQTLSFEELDREFMKYHICAIGTTKGINYFDN